MLNQENKIILLSALGGAFEFYNYMIYIIFAPIISQVLLPHSAKLIGLISIYSISAIGYFARPLGGVIFSHFGDKHGRKKTFISSIVLMAIPTLLIGLLPSYNQIGIFSTLLLVLFVFIQAFSVGGETPGAITFACEHVNPGKRGLTCGIIIAFLNVGILTGMSINLLLTHCLTHQQLLAWGWRLPFIFGGFLGVLAIHLRRKMTESPLFIAFKTAARQEKIPLFEAIRGYWREIIQGIAITWLGGVVISLLFVYLPTYLTTVLSYPKEQIAVLNTLNLLFYSTLIIVVSNLADKIGRRTVILFGSSAFIFLSYFIFLSFNHPSHTHLILTMFLIAGFSSCIAVYPGVLVDLFPTSIRYTGIALAFNIGGIFGGLSPLIATYLIGVTNDKLAPSYYLMLSAFICFIVTISLKNKYDVIS